MLLDTKRECLFCDYCGGTYCPEPNADGVRILGGDTGRKCPVCGAHLVHAKAGGQRVSYCETCAGFLVDMALFIHMIDGLRSEGRAALSHLPEVEWRELDRKLQCPSCGSAMNTHPYCGPGNIIIDNCELCELNWLDRGELTRVARAPDHTYSV
jgi:Zn-finger nucleic acid-binding protein